MAPVLLNLWMLLLVLIATGKAWQTPLGRYAPQHSESAAEGMAWALVLQLPLEGLLSNGGGVHFVIKRAQGSQPEWLSGPHNKDFFISLDQVVTKLIGFLTAVSLSPPWVHSFEFEKTNYPAIQSWLAP